VHSVEAETSEIITVANQVSIQKYRITDNCIELCGYNTNKTVNCEFCGGKANDIIEFKDGIKREVV
jgi:hypothetical protein